MIKFIYVHKFKSLINKIFWKYLLSKKFKEYGVGANIFFPDYIVGDEYISIKSNVYIGYKASIIVVKESPSTPNLIIGEGTKIRRFFHIVCIDQVIIGRDVLIADKVLITDNIHGYQDITTPILKQPLEPLSKVTIGDGTCLGENVCVIGANIGKNCTIGANSVVISDIPDYSIAVGTPAKVIKYYDFDKAAWVKP